MADKNYNVNLNIDTTGVDKATQSVKQLTTATQQLDTTTQTIAKSVVIEYNKAGQAINVVTDSSQRLQRQSTALVNAMAELARQGKQNTQEFTLLQQKHLQLNDTIEKTKGTSKDLFATLSILPLSLIHISEPTRPY